MIVARFVSFRSSGLSDPASGVRTFLGPGPRGYATNAMQLHFRLSDPLAEELVRWRRRVTWVVWERLVNRKRYQRIYGMTKQPDDPPLGLGTGALPDLYDIDTPGLTIFAQPMRRLRISGAVLGDLGGERGRVVQTQAAAKDIVVAYNFTQWVEVYEGGEWTRVSEKFWWTSFLDLRWEGGTRGCAGHRPRGRGSVCPGWNPGRRCMIAPGHIHLMRAPNHVPPPLPFPGPP